MYIAVIFGFVGGTGYMPPTTSIYYGHLAGACNERYCPRPLAGAFVRIFAQKRQILSVFPEKFYIIPENPYISHK